MASKNCPETPRQKMIGMMYLMLTAMLALNVSAEVLNGFTMISTSLRASIDSTEDRTARLYREFSAMNEQNPTKVGEWYARADSLRTASNSLYEYIQIFKADMIHLADRNADPNDLQLTNRTKADLNVAGQLAITEGRGRDLQRRLQEHRDFLIRLTDNDSIKRAMYEALFDVDDANWVDARFRMMPLGAALTVLTKYQNDVRIAEMDMVQFLQRQTDAGDIRVNRISAIPIPHSSFVMQGDTYISRIILAAEDTTARPRVFVDGVGELGEDGVFRRAATAPGTFSYRGHVEFTGSDGEIQRYRFENTFTVGQPAATISNVDLNVVYRGIDNRFSVSVPGIAAENVRVRANGANVRPAGNFFIINPTQDTDIRIIVEANINGRTAQMGAMDFRVRQIPDPKAFIQYRDAGGVLRQIDIEGRLSRAAMRHPDFALIASYGPDELIQANFNVVSFSVRTRIGAVPAQGSRLTPRQLQDIERLERGDMITFADIRATGPDGTERRLGNLIITLN